MSNSRSVAPAALAGLAAGVVLMLALWVVVRPSSEPAVLVTETIPTTSTTTTVVPWVSIHESRIGPAVLVPDSLQVQSGQLLLTYDMVNITAGSTGDELHAAAGPDRWTLVTTDGDVTARAIGPTSRSVRFSVGDGFTLDQIVEVRVDSYRVAAPARWPLPLALNGSEPVEAGPGLTFRLVQVVEQAENFLVIVETDAEASLIDQLTVDGESRDWASSSVSLLGSPRWTLDYRGEALPDPLPLVVRGLSWIEVDEGAVVNLTGVME